MEVIETPLYFKAVCEKCATRIKYDIKDVIPGDYYNGYQSHILCPECNYWIDHTYHNAVYMSDAVLGIDLAGEPGKEECGE